jgi:2'-5' RNA ligase
MLQAVASLLEGECRERVEEIWAGMESRFGIEGNHAGHLPHLSYQVACRYDTEPARKVLKNFARDVAPFEVETSGLGVFTGERPVLYISVVRDPALSWLHRMIWREVSAAASGVADYYSPRRWIPHITLAHGEGVAEHLPEIVRWLGERDFDWRVPARNLALIQSAGPEHQLLFSLDLDGKPRT